MALTAFAGSVFAAEAETAAASGGAPPVVAPADDAAATDAGVQAEAKELERDDAAVDASSAAAAVDPDHLLSHDEMDAMMKDAGFTLNKETGLYDPPAGVDKSQLSRQVMLPDSGADHAAFANVLLDQQHKFIQVEHGEFSLPAGEFFYLFFWSKEKENRGESRKKKLPRFSLMKRRRKNPSFARLAVLLAPVQLERERKTCSRSKEKRLKKKEKLILRQKK